MNWLDILYPETAQAQELRRIANATTRLATTASVAQDELQALANENRELRLYLTAITQLLVDKGLLQPAEIQQRVQALFPPLPIHEPTAAVTNDDNPFADMR